jgi:hypothetical protein
VHFPHGAGVVVVVDVVLVVLVVVEQGGGLLHGVRAVSQVSVPGYPGKQQLQPPVQVLFVNTHCEPFQLQEQLPGQGLIVVAGGAQHGQGVVVVLAH